MGHPDIAASPAGKDVADLGRNPGLHLKLSHRNLERLSALGRRRVQRGRQVGGALDEVGAERDQRVERIDPGPEVPVGGQDVRVREQRVRALVGGGRRLRGRGRRRPAGPGRAG